MTYSYTDERGALLYEACRFEPKTFRPRYPDGRGGWIWKKCPRQVFYHLPEVLEAPIVFVVEGERDVETLREWGFCATTNAWGAEAPWLPEFTATLKGKEVIIIPDNDVPGMRHAATVGKALLRHVAKLIIPTLEGGAKDLTEWFEQGHSEVEFISLVEGDKVTR